MKYGLYVGGRVSRLCARPDDPARVAELVDDLAGGGPLVIREYVHHLGPEADPDLAAALDVPRELERLTMPDAWYESDGRELDLVVSYIPAVADVDGWLHFLDAVIDRYGHLTRHLQVTLEPNFPIPLIDGSAPGVFDALTQGIPHARRRLDAQGRESVGIGFSVAEPPEWLGGDDAFWAHLGALPPSQFAAYVDYVGLALYPDAFAPVALDDVGPLVTHAIEHLRRHSMPAAKLPGRIPIRIVENGTPSGAPRTPEYQAASLMSMVAAVEAAASEHVTHYELFALRDADSAGDTPTATLGLVTDTYERKPAYERFRELTRLGRG
jgi:hypothetical protein